MKLCKFYISVLLTLIFSFAFINQALSQSKYDTDIVITNYDIDLTADFKANSLELAVITSMKNLSSINIDKVDINLCSSGETEDFVVVVEDIFQIEKGERKHIEFSKKKIENPFNQETTWSLYEIIFENYLKPDQTTEIEFNYTIKGKKNEECFPMKKGKVEELYLISDFHWLPAIYITPEMGQFHNLYRPSWSLKLKYPASYAAAVEGKSLRRNESDGYIKEEWKSIINKEPQVFIAQYDVIKKKKGDFTLELYLAKDEEVKENTILLEDDIMKILELYTDLYGSSGSNTFRMIASYTPWGAHGVYMGAVLDRNFFKLGGLKTLAHEMAHIWWGGTILSYGEGSKFLREAMAEFSSAWALKSIKGDDYANNLWIDFKIKNFCYYVVKDEVSKQYPLIMQKGYNPHGIIISNYDKGPLVLNALRLELGDELFFKSLRTFAEKFYNKNATMSDFIEIVNSVSSKNMTPRFKELCWGTGYPIYRLNSFTSTQENGSYKTIVTIKNEGEIAVLCPLLLKTSSEEITKWFKVKGKTAKEFAFKSEYKVIDVVIDPEMTTFQYHPEQRIGLWKTFDESYFGGRNWLWFNKSYVYYLIGRYKKAVDTLSKYLDKNKKTKQEKTFTPLYCSYKFTRAFYFLALQDEISAEKDIKDAAPFLFDSLIDKNIMWFFTHTGIIKEPEPEKQVIEILNTITHKNFNLDPDLSEEVKKGKVEEWKQWWEKEKQYQNLDLSGLYKWIRPSMKN
jgi:hypothetical protein